MSIAPIVQAVTVAVPPDVTSAFDAVTPRLSGIAAACARASRAATHTSSSAKANIEPGRPRLIRRDDT